MVAPTLPVSRLINVAVNLSPSAASAQSLSTLMVLGSSNIIDTTERYRVYSDIASVAADFGTSLPEYLAAVLWFEQLPQPSNLLIGRWAKTATNGVLRGAPLSQAQQAITNFNTITDGKFIYTLDGGSPTTTSAINLTSASNLPAVAAAITTLTTGAIFTWDSTYQRFEAQSETTGTSSAVSFLSTPGSGTDLSGLLEMQSTDSGAYTVTGIAAETALQAVTLFDSNFGQKFYGFQLLGAVQADYIACAGYVEASGNKHIFFITTQDSGVLVSVTTSDIAYQLSQLAYHRSFTQFSSTTQHAVASAAARMLTTDYTGNNTVIDLMYKQEPGIVPENLTPAQADSVDTKCANVFVEYDNNTAIIQRGRTASGLFLDIITGTDWLSLTIQAALYNLLYTSSTKIPQTDAGMNLLVNAVEAVCAQGVTNGLLAPGTWETGGFGILNQGDFLVKGYYVYAPKVSTQNVADRAARRAVPIQVAAKLAGAVQTISLVINVNQ